MGHASGLFWARRSGFPGSEAHQRDLPHTQPRACKATLGRIQHPHSPWNLCAKLRAKTRGRRRCAMMCLAFRLESWHLLIELPFPKPEVFSQLPWAAEASWRCADFHQRRQRPSRKGWGNAVRAAISTRVRQVSALCGERERDRGWSC